MSLHKTLTGDDVHVIQAFTYANAAARTGATGFVTADIGRVARQTDNNTFWVLVAATPTWSELTGVASSVAHSGLTGLGADDHTQYQLRSEENAAGGYAGLDGSTKLAGAQQVYGTGVNTACQGDDARLADARTPTAHATSHVTGGSDVIPNAVADGNAGLLSGVDKTTLNNAVTTTRTVTAGAGLTGGGNLSVNRTLDVVADADGSIVVSADAVKVGVLATDAQHGNRGGGALHAAAIAAGAAGFLTGADKTKVDRIDQGTCRMIVGLRDGVTSGANVVDASTNNNMGALAFRNQASDCESRWMLRVPRNWISGDIIVRLWWSSIASGSSGQKVRWELGYKFQTVNTDIGAYTTVTNSQDVSAYVADRLVKLDALVIPAAAVDLNADLMAIRVARIPSHSDDNYAQDVYLHAIELEFNGNRIGGIHGAV